LGGLSVAVCAWTAEALTVKIPAGAASTMGDPVEVNAAGSVLGRYIETTPS
jgi:hypothetical protein